MIRTILVAADGSESSLAGIRLAAGWAATLQTALRVVFVEEEERFLTYTAIASDAGAYPVAIPLAPDKLAAEKQRVEAERSAIDHAYRQATKSRVSDSRFESIAGATNSVLIQAARGVDLVVVGKRGRFETRESNSPGPTTEALIHAALRPVIVVPEQPRFDSSLLIAFDDSAGVQRILPFAVELAERFGNRIVVLTVHEKPDQAQRIQESVKSYLQNRKLESKFVPAQGDPAQAILRVADEERIGMIAMGAFGRNPVYELFFGSVTRSVLERAKNPVLLMA
jgi:nucleotide-binding universal stress UspA family protein